MPARLGRQRPQPGPRPRPQPFLALQPSALQQQRTQTTQSQQRSRQQGLKHAAAARNMSPPAQQLTRPGQAGQSGQSQHRSLAFHTTGRPTAAGPGPGSGSAAPPPPRSRSDYSSAPAAISLPSAAARINPSTAQLRPSSVSRTAQIARHLHSQHQHARRYTTNSTMASSYSVRKVGAPNTLAHRVYVEKDGVPVSPFHDIPLYANQEKTILNMVVEIPRWTNAKLEVRPVFSACLMSFRIEDAAPACSRSPRTSSSTPSSRTSRRASSASSATASRTRATCGTTAPSPRYVFPRTAPRECRFG